MFTVTEGQLSSVENWRTICTARESPPAIVLLITVLGTLNVNVSINQTIWKTISLMIKGRNLKQYHLWLRRNLTEALHSVRTLLSTATNTTPHERFLPFLRRSMLDRSLPTWLITPNTVLLKRFVRNKSEPLCDEVELLDANPKTALVRSPDGRESTVSVSDLAPFSDMDDNEPCDVPETTSESKKSARPNQKIFFECNLLDWLIRLSSWTAL